MTASTGYFSFFKGIGEVSEGAGAKEPNEASAGMIRLKKNRVMILAISETMDWEKAAANFCQRFFDGTGSLPGQVQGGGAGGVFLGFFRRRAKK